MRGISREEIIKEYEIVKACLHKPALFEYFYNKYFQDIYYFIYRRVSEESLAEDLTADAFLKAYQKLHTFKEMGVPFSAWLFRIALNEVNMHYRSSKKTIMISIERTQVNMIREEIHQELQEENMVFLGNALGSLKDKDRQMIEMRFFEKMSFREIGLIFGITENNAKVKVYRIIEKLKKFFPAS